VADSAWIALSLVRHLGGKTFRALLAHFDHDLQAILVADEAALRAVPGIGAQIAHAISASDVEQIARRIEQWHQTGVQIVTYEDHAYPADLRSLEDAPPTLFIRGRWPDWIRRHAYAVVGSRRPTPEGELLAGWLGYTLAEAGYIVVSGLARGIDAGAHLGALAAGGMTVAVLGSGVLNIYPPEHQDLATAVMYNGALVAEVAPETTVGAPGLVARNRIITGLSAGVIVVETGIDGGAMHAARFARLQGRTVYAVANDAEGNRELIAGGAVPVPPDEGALLELLPPR
jgi:DNA processing protein